MSRTNKDRPAWVIQNDRTHGVVEDHNHLRLGVTHTRTITRGERLLVECSDYMWFLRHADGTPGMTVEEDADERFHHPTWGSVRTGGLRWYYERPVRFEWVGRTEIEVVAPDYCTVNDWVSRESSYWSIPCSLEPARRRHRCDTTKEMRRRGYHAPMRRRANAAMHQFVGEYNSFGDVDDSTWQDTQHRRAPFGGGYWD